MNKYTVVFLNNYMYYRSGGHFLSGQWIVKTLQRLSPPKIKATRYKIYNVDKECRDGTMMYFCIKNKQLVYFSEY